jgi:hypothetical protein
MATTNTTATFAELGAVFNDATRLLAGGAALATAAAAAHTVSTTELVSPNHACDANVAGAHHHHLGHVWG